MSSPSLTMLTAFELARRVRAREISPVAIVEAHLDAIARHNPRLNAVVTLTAERALDQARALERRLDNGEPVGQLAGVPLGVKDIHVTKGVRTSFGSTLMKDHVPDSDALIVARCLAADAIMIGKNQRAGIRVWREHGRRGLRRLRLGVDCDDDDGGSGSYALCAGSFESAALNQPTIHESISLATIRADEMID